jgi:hypothetical protein
MDRLEQYSNFRAGVIYRVAGVKPTTVRSWGVEIGTQTSGHPRYSALDAVTVVLMGELTVANRMMAARAVKIVNSLRPKLDEVMRRVEGKTQDTPKKWRWMGGPYAVIGSDRTNFHDGPAELARQWRSPVIAIAEDNKQLAEFCSHFEQGLSLMVVPLPRLINKVMMALDNIFSGSDPFCSPEMAEEDC